MNLNCLELDQSDNDQQIDLSLTDGSAFKALFTTRPL